MKFHEAITSIQDSANEYGVGPIPEIEKCMCFEMPTESDLRFISAYIWKAKANKWRSVYRVGFDGALGAWGIDERIVRNNDHFDEPAFKAVKILAVELS